MSGWSLTGKVILVTGGARGIGAATAAELARRGAVPVLADLDTDALQSASRLVGGDPLTIELDVTDPVACKQAVSETTAHHGRLDVVWANAGIASFGPLALTDPDVWARTIEVNLVGAFRTVRAGLPAVIAARGYVAVTASMASFGHAPGMSAYSAAKAGVEAMCNSLRVEVAHQGVDVASIHPSWIATDMLSEGEDELTAFTRLRSAMRGPVRNTYPVERAARDIADGFERRAPRICTPRFMQLAHVLRPALTTRLFQREILRAAPEMLELYQRDLVARGSAGASASERTLSRMPAAERDRTPSMTA